MKAYAFALLLAALNISAPGLRAQDLSQILPPKPPLVAAVPTNADWTITVRYPASPPAQPGRPDSRIVEVHSTKTGQFKRDRIAYAGAKPDEHWFAGPLFLWADAQGEVSVSDLAGVIPDNADPNPSVASGFPGIAWLRIDHYDRVIMVEKRPCYHYLHEKTEAWIDVETLLPVAYKSSDLLFRFTFNAPPDAPLTLPPAYQKAFEFCQGAIDRRKKVAKALSQGR